ncbi:MAG: hypothetical protein LIP02_02715 [Bacteroidales bacterium]|nr:hypothetical protein [Bacteroidales bacterium]
MKKELLATLAAVALMGATSCSSDDPQMGTTGQEVTVTVTASLPADIQSRSFSDGYTATKFFYAVYETDGTTSTCVIPKTVGKDFNGLETTLSLQLVTGKSYEMVFWAQSDYSITNEIFTVAEDLSTVTLNYEKLKELTAAQMENVDAFWCMKPVTVEGAATVTAELKRPFAQINVGTTDIAAPAVAGKKVYTTMTVAGVYSQYNLLTGEVLDATTQTATFTKVLRPNHDVATTADEYEQFPVGDKGAYEYLEMAYVLMSKDKKTVDIDLDFYFDDDATAANHLDVDGAPVQRNYRTNIFGALLTSTIDFTITIKPDYETPDWSPSVSKWDGSTSSTPAIDDTNKTITVASAAQLAGLVELVNAGNSYEDYTVNLTVDVDLNQQEWTEIGTGKRSSYYATGYAFKGTFNGNGHNITGLKITQSSDADAAKGLFGVLDGATVKHLTIDADVEVSTNELAGALAGFAVNGSTIMDVTVNGKLVICKGGGVVGRMTIDGTIQDCTNNAEITGSGANVGGIVGAAYYNREGKAMKISNCVNNGNITNTAGSVGGIVGLNCANVSGCSNYGTVTGNGADVAGIIAEQQNAGSVSDCHNYAEITNNSSDAFGTGGVIGWIRYHGATQNYEVKEVVKVTNCSNSANITGGNDAGGIVGTVYNYAILTACSNTAEKLWAVGFAAGIIGNVQENASSNITGLDHYVEINQCTSTTTLENITANCKNLIVYDNAKIVTINN